MFNSPNSELYKKDNKVILDNIKKAKKLIDRFKNGYTTAMFNEIKETEKTDNITKQKSL